MLEIYNTFTKSKEPFQPIHPPRVNFYACGMTVYDYCHIGHARTLIAVDVMIRFLKFSQYQVKYVRNITDIDDKIIRRANENHEEYSALTERFIQALNDDAKHLGLIKPDEEPRATEYIPEIIRMVEQLIETQTAYIGQNGDVYFDISRFKDYGKLSHRNINDLIAGARVDVEEAKHHPLDFVLWKLAKPGEPNWDSPWGKGRPGWHIECSAMATSCLAKHIDIHAGGVDLVFPHHENEIAQSEASQGEKYVETWVHIGHLQVNKEKMSKSLGNFLTIREVLKKYHPEVLRFFMISGHYRSPLSYSEEAMQGALQALERLYLAIRDCPHDATINQESEYLKLFLKAMEDDFNTPKALSVLFELANKLNKLKTENDPSVRQYASLLIYLGQLLGLFYEEPDKFLQGNACSLDDAQKIESMIQQRNKARSQKNWIESDRLRDELKQMGVVIEDGSTGTTWRKD